ncbi:hypothetical protein [Pedobacter panaciterrae]
MKINKGLFEKKIDLKSCQINGGKMAFGTMSDCQVRTWYNQLPRYTLYVL